MDVNSGPVDSLLLGAATTDGLFAGATAGISQAINFGPHDVGALIWIGNGTISGGTAVLEEAYWAADGMPYSGTWSNIAIGALTASSLTGNAQQVIHLPQTAYKRMRVRITSPITGGGGITAVLRVG